jgi:hypothetical protein
VLGQELEQMLLQVLLPAHGPELTQARARVLVLVLGQEPEQARPLGLGLVPVPVQELELAPGREVLLIWPPAQELDRMAPMSTLLSPQRDTQARLART